MIVNSKGEWAGGEKGPIVSFIKNILQSSAGAVKFLNDDELLFQDYHDGVAKLGSHNVRTGIRTKVADYGLTELTAGNNFWARWFSGPGPEEALGITTSKGLHLRKAWMPSLITLDGSFAFKEDYQSTGPWYVQFPDDSRQLLSANEITEVNLLDKRQVVFRGNNGLMTGINLTFDLKQPLTRNYYSLRVIKVNNEYWYLYQAEGGRLLFHPIGDEYGYLLAPENSEVFRPHAAQFSTHSVMVAWATREDELPELQLTRIVDIESSRVKLTPTVSPIVNDIMIPAFEKPIWQAPFFSHSDQYGDTPLDKHVGNAIWLRTSDKSHNPGTLPLITAVNTNVNDVDQNLTVAYWEGSGTIQELLERIRIASAYPEKPIIAYLDGDGWPTTNPFSSDRVWPAIQAYCSPNESLSHFEVRITDIINRVQGYKLPIVLTSRFDDFNGSQSIDNIIACMPLYEKWIRNFNFVGHMPFSDRRGNAISSNENLWLWARRFQYAIPAGRPNRFDYWRPAGMSEKQVLDNKLHQSRAAVVLEPYLRDYILNFDNGSESLEWPDLLPLVKEVRAKYPEKITCDECVKVVNEVAKHAPAQYEFGLLEKKSGNHGTLSNGTKCSVDWIVSRKLGKGCDCLISCPNSQDGPEKDVANPTWTMSPEEFDLTKWVEPT